MSIKIMSAVFESETLGPTERLIMLALADHADDAGRCYPSTSRLCQRTGLGARAVQTNLKRLQAQGYISIVPNGGPKGANLFFVRATPAADAPPQQVRPRTKSTPAADAPPQQVRPRTKSTPAADAPPHLNTSTPAANADEPSGTVIGGGGSACASETDPTWREQMLQAMGVGADGIVGPSRFIGSVADMATAAQWEDSLKLDRPTIIAVLTETIAGKRDGPPKSFRYFTPAMQRTAAELQAPPLQPTEIEGPRHERPIASDRRQAAADDRHRRIIIAAATARSPSGPAF